MSSEKIVHLDGYTRYVEQHEFSALFPPMGEAEFTWLVADIRSRGLQEPIVLLEGKILDGWHRHRACRECKVKPIFIEWANVRKGGDPLDFVIGRNLHRRHLDSTQRATVAAKIATMRQGARTDLPQNCGKLSQTEAAARMNVSPRLVQSATTVLKRGATEVIQALAAGKITASGAEGIVKQSSDKDQQRAALAEHVARRGMGAASKSKGKLSDRERVWQRLSRPLSQLAELRRLHPDKAVAGVAHARDPDIRTTLVQTISHLQRLLAALPKTRGCK
jgi:hypothetical protein